MPHRPFAAIRREAPSWGDPDRPPARVAARSVPLAPIIIGMMLLGAPAAAQEPPPDEGAVPETPSSEPTVDDLVRTVIFGTPAEREEALEALRGLGPEALPAIEAAIDDLAEARSLLEGVAVPEGGRSPRAGGERDPWYVRSYELALLRFNRGDFAGALQVVDAILTLDPEPSVGQALRSLRVDCEERLLRQSTVRADLSPSRAVAGFGEAIRLRLTIENVGEYPIRLVPPANGNAGTIGVLEEAFTFMGERSRVRESQMIRLAQPIVLAPQARWETTIVVSEGGAARGPAFVRYSIWGTLRPQALMVERPGESAEQLPSRFLPLFQVQVSICDPTYAPLADAARRHAEEALAALCQDPPSGTLLPLHAKLFHAALLASPEDRLRLVGPLVESLDHIPAASTPTVTLVLAYLTDRFLDPDPDSWRRWWHHRPQGDR